jgi:hypothetical protein
MSIKTWIKKLFFIGTLEGHGSRTLPPSPLSVIAERVSTNPFSLWQVDTSLEYIQVRVEPICTTDKKHGLQVECNFFATNKWS